MCATWTADADTFVLRSRTFPVGSQPCAIAAADLNDDGFPDVVTTDRGTLADPREPTPANNEVTVLLSTEPWQYVRHHPALKTGFGPYDIALANIDALRWPDIVVANFHDPDDHDVTLFVNRFSEQAFEAVSFSVPDDGLRNYRLSDGDGVSLFVEPGLTALAIADLDGDGLRDAVATGWSSDVLVVLPGAREGYFGDPVLIDAPGGPRDLAIADLNGDDRLDLAVVLYAQQEVAVWVAGDEPFAFEPGPRFRSRGRLPRAIAVEDFNRDSFLDIAVAHGYADDSVVVFFGEANLGYSGSREIVLGETRNALEHELRDVVAGDFNEDGWPDLAAPCSASSTVSILINEGGEPGDVVGFEREDYRFTEGAPHAIAAADFDQDGDVDLAVTLWNPDAVAFLSNQKE